MPQANLAPRLRARFRWPIMDRRLAPEPEQPPLPVPPVPEPEPDYPDLLPEYLEEYRRRIPMPRRRPELGPGAYELGEETYAPGPWQKALGAAAAGFVGGFRGPEAGLALHREIFESPYARAMGEYAGQEELRGARLRSLAPALEAETRRAEIKRLSAPKAKQPYEFKEGGRFDPNTGEWVSIPGAQKPEKPSTTGAGRTIETGGRIKQFNLETGQYDIDVGPVQPREQGPTSASLAAAAAAGDEKAARALKLLRSSQEPVVIIRTMDDEGNPITKVLPRSEASGKEFVSQPPEEARVKALARQRTSEFSRKLKGISDRLITKRNALEQRLFATGRSVKAALENDPDYRVFVDYRAALAAAMGTAEQGSRISDFDVTGVYAPMIPDVFRDTVDSAKVKWELIGNRFSAEPKTPSGAAGRPAAGGGREAPPVNLLKEGVITTFKNGQSWRLQNGIPVQVK